MPFGCGDLIGGGVKTPPYGVGCVLFIRSAELRFPAQTLSLRSPEGAAAIRFPFIVCGEAATSFRRQANIVYTKRNIVFRRKPRSAEPTSFSPPLSQLTLTAPPPSRKKGRGRSLA